MVLTHGNVPAEAPMPRGLVRDRAAALVLAAGLIFGLLADWLFYGKGLGVSYPLFIAFGLAALAVLAPGRSAARAGRAWVLAVPVLVFAAAVALRAHPFLMLLNVGASLGVLAILAYAVAGPAWTRLPLIGYPVAALRALGEAGLRAPVLAVTAVSFRDVAPQERGRVFPILRGLLLAVPVVLVFAWLFASADLVFNRHLAELLRMDFLTLLARAADHALFMLLAAWFVAGGLAYCLRRVWAADHHVLGLPDRWLAGAGADAAGLGGLRLLGRNLLAEGVLCRPWRRPRLGAVEADIVLAAVVALFATFVAIQATYLFGGQANITVEGFTYAEYARRGFFELVAVALLALGLGLGLLQVVDRRPDRLDLVFRGLLTLLAGLVLVVLASAAQRLLLYEQAYGFTTARLFSHVFMATLAGVMVWFVVIVWWRPERFAVGAFVAMMAFVAVLDVMNPDAFIVRQNVARYEATGDLDTEYLQTLSPDAVPELAGAVPLLGAPEQAEVRSTLTDFQRWLSSHDPEPWQSYNMGRARARWTLAGISWEGPPATGPGGG